METYRLLEHTADMGLEAGGDTLAELFQAAARGLMSIACPDGRSGSGTEKRVRIDGLDKEELLVNWLNEILFLLQNDDFFPGDFTITAIDETSLEARLGGERLAGQTQPFEHEIKAVTYHGLKVERDDGGWRARVYVDL